VVESSRKTHTEVHTEGCRARRLTRARHADLGDIDACQQRGRGAQDARGHTVGGHIVQVVVGAPAGGVPGEEAHGKCDGIPARSCSVLGGMRASLIPRPTGHPRLLADLTPGA